MRVWDLRSPNCSGLLNITSPSLAAFDPSGIIFAVASHTSSAILLYDLRNYDKQPFTTFTLTDDPFLSTFSYPPRMPVWSKLEFSNDGKHMLVGTRGHAHYVIDSFAENTSQFLYRTKRPNGPTNPKKVETSGDVCFTPDARYIVGGQGERGVVLWDTWIQPDEKRNLKPFAELAEMSKSMASVVAFNPKMNLFATAHKDVVCLCFYFAYCISFPFRWVSFYTLSLCPTTPYQSTIHIGPLCVLTHIPLDILAARTTRTRRTSIRNTSSSKIRLSICACGSLCVSFFSWLGSINIISLL